ncbi:protein mono-ADP-ribosyltransferase PARP15-like [Ciona intestinalis]
MKRDQTMDSCSRLPFEELHKQAKQTANEDLASNLPKAPIVLVNTTKEKFNKRIQKICEEYRAAYKDPEEELFEDAKGKILESVTMYKNMVGEAMDNSCISETDFEHVHQQSKAAALECWEKSSIRDKEKFSNTLNTAIKQEHNKALEVLKTRLATLNTVAEQQATKPMHSFKFGEIIVQVANCGITDLPKSNIIVNSVGSDFNLARGQVSRILLRHVGPQLQTECKNNPKFATESYRITSGGNLCDHIVHYVLPSEEYQIEESIMELLEKCDTLGAITVVMPVLGSGNRGIPVARCAQFLWAAICLLNSYRKPTHLNCIKIPAYDVIVFNGLVEFFNKPPKFLGFPTHWGTVSKGTTEMKRLASDSKEYNAVVAAFQKSNPPVNKIVLIERIQNPSLYKQYEGKREAMVDKVQNSVIERELFHGTTEEASNKIINNYFNRSYAGKHATSYGEGVYFALNSSYSHKFCRRDVRHMLVVKVLTGDYCLGTKQMKEPPKIDGTNRAYHSLVNNVNNPTIFVVFNDASAYPKYRITYT